MTVEQGLGPYDTVVLGGGPAGLTAALYCGRARLKTLLVEKQMAGGQAAATELIDNYPGFPDGIMGPELTANMEAQAKRFGAEFAFGEASGLALEGGTLRVRLPDRTLDAKTVIIATGVNPRPLGIPGEKEFRGRGVSYCATCDGAFFRDQDVIVVGGGDAAVEEAIFLTKFANHVTIVHRRDQLRAAKVVQERALANPKVSVAWNSHLIEIRGETTVQEAVVQDKLTGEKTVLPVAGIFMYVGNTPNTEFLPEEIARDDSGYIITDERLATSVPGVFAAGDCRKNELKQVIVAAGEGAVAAVSAERYIETLD